MRSVFPQTRETFVLSNPHLPDWAVVDVTTAPTRLAPGKVVAADFFDEAWQFKSE